MEVKDDLNRCPVCGTALIPDCPCTICAVEKKAADRGIATRIADSRKAHAKGGARAGIREYCRGNKWLTENAKAVGNW